MSVKRSICENCERPTTVCYCSGLPSSKLQLQVSLIIFQDPREDKQAFNSVRLLEKSIDNIEIIRGRKFPPMAFQDAVLLYPSRTASHTLPDSVKTIILIDATWTFAKSLYNKNEWLQSIPTVRLLPVSEPIYAPLRKPPKPGLVSTAEALILMLEMIGDLQNAQALRQALQVAVDVEPWQQQVFKKKLAENL